VYDAVTEALLDEKVKSQPEVRGRLLESVLKTLDDSQPKLRSSIEMKPSTSDLMDTGNYQEPAREFMAKFTTRE